MLHRRNRSAAIIPSAIAVLELLSVPVMAEVARLTTLPLGRGTATISWTAKRGVTPVNVIVHHGNESSAYATFDVTE